MPLTTTAAQSAAGVQSRRLSSHGRIAERIRRAVAAFEPDLMRAVSLREAHPIILGEFEAAVRIRISHDLRARHAGGVELIVPCRVERVRPIDAFAVTADLDHLRTAGIGLAVWMRRAARDAADMHRAGKLGLPVDRIFDDGNQVTMESR